MGARFGEKLLVFQLEVTKAWVVGDDEHHLLSDDNYRVYTFDTREAAQKFADEYNAKL